tara:strand:+ start:720 stop:1154 length:435 start_codon:yes stop_codon:yes gene_type:complete
MKTKLTKLTDMPERKYQGYVWYSDQKEPKVLQNEIFRFENIGLNPFVVEALLWHEDDKTAGDGISVMVRHTGTYHIHEFEMDNLPEHCELVEKEYLPHRLGNNIEKVKFKQLWLPEKDPNCLDMEVLTMKALIFVGFETKTKNA